MKFEFIELSNEKVYFFKRIFDLIKKIPVFPGDSRLLSSW